MARTRPHGWEIPGVDETTKRQLKVYAAMHGLTLAQALKQLLDEAAAGPWISPSGDRPLRPQHPTRSPLKAD